MNRAFDRRTFITGVAAVGLVLPAQRLAAQTAATPDGDIAADTAHSLQQSGGLIIVDVRRPDEWAATGSPEGAVQLDMRRADFADAVARLRSENPGLPVAMICMRGARSTRVTNQLLEAGFTDVLNIPEGMLGSAAGPGWLQRGLPTYGRG